MHLLGSSRERPRMSNARRLHSPMYPEVFISLFSASFAYQRALMPSCQGMKSTYRWHFDGQRLFPDTVLLPWARVARTLRQTEAKRSSHQTREFQSFRLPHVKKLAISIFEVRPLALLFIAASSDVPAVFRTTPPPLPRAPPPAPAATPAAAGRRREKPPTPLPRVPLRRPDDPSRNRGGAAVATPAAALPPPLPRAAPPAAAENLLKLQAPSL